MAKKDANAEHPAMRRFRELLESGALDADRLAEYLSTTSTTPIQGATEPTPPPNFISPELIYTIPQASEVTGLHPKTLEKACREGTLPAGKRAKAWRILGSDLRDWLLSSEKPTKKRSSRGRG